MAEEYYDGAFTGAQIDAAVGKALVMHQQSYAVAGGKKAVITLSSYECALRAFGILGASDRIDLLYSYGRKYDGITGGNITVTRSADYKTLTISNGGSSIIYLGVAFYPSDPAQTISVTVESI